MGAALSSRLLEQGSMVLHRGTQALRLPLLQEAVATNLRWSARLLTLALLVVYLLLVSTFALFPRPSQQILTPPRPEFHVDTSSGRIHDKHGRERIFHGVNVVFKDFPWHPQLEGFDPLLSFSDEDVQILRRLGFNVVRLGVMWPGVHPARGRVNETYARVMRGIADKLWEAGIHTLVNFHQDVFAGRFCGEGVPDWLLDDSDFMPAAVQASAVGRAEGRGLSPPRKLGGDLLASGEEGRSGSLLRGEAGGKGERQELGSQDLPCFGYAVCMRPKEYVESFPEPLNPRFRVRNDLALHVDDGVEAGVRTSSGSAQQSGEGDGRILQGPGGNGGQEGGAHSGASSVHRLLREGAASGGGWAPGGELVPVPSSRSEVHKANPDEKDGNSPKLSVASGVSGDVHSMAAYSHSLSMWPRRPRRPRPSNSECDSIGWGLYHFSFAVSRAFQDLYENRWGWRDRFAEYWRDVATTFKGHPGVLGYELMNEPWVGDVFLNPLLLTPGVADRLNFEPLYEHLQGAIRGVDPSRLLFFETNTFDNAANGLRDVPGGGGYANMSVLSYHYYRPPNVAPRATFKQREGERTRLRSGWMLTEFGIPNPMPEGWEETGPKEDAREGEGKVHGRGNKEGGGADVPGADQSEVQEGEALDCGGSGMFAGDVDAWKGFAKSWGFATNFSSSEQREKMSLLFDRAWKERKVAEESGSKIRKVVGGHRETQPKVSAGDIVAAATSAAAALVGAKPAAAISAAGADLARPLIKGDADLAVHKIPKTLKCGTHGCPSLNTIYVRGADAMDKKRTESEESLQNPEEEEGEDDKIVGGSWDELAEVLRLADNHAQSWMAWEYKPFVPITGANYGLFEPGGSGELHPLVVQYLARTYPMAVAGRLLQFSYDPKTSLFEMEYVAGGGEGPREGRSVGGERRGNGPWAWLVGSKDGGGWAWRREQQTLLPSQLLSSHELPQGPQQVQQEGPKQLLWLLPLGGGGEGGKKDDGDDSAVSRTTEIALCCEGQKEVEVELAGEKAVWEIEEQRVWLRHEASSVGQKITVRIRPVAVPMDESDDVQRHES